MSEIHDLPALRAAAEKATQGQGPFTSIIATKDELAMHQKATPTVVLWLLDRVEARNEDNPCAQALNELWRDVILAHKPDYGDWGYPGMAYRHLLAEFNDMRVRVKALERELSAAKADPLSLLPPRPEADGPEPEPFL